MRRRPAMLFPVLLSLALTAGCFGGGGRTAKPATPAVSSVPSGTVIPGTVTASRAAGGRVEVRWKTSVPTSGSHVLAARLFFQDKAMYDIVAKESVVEPATDHLVTFDAPGAGRLAVGIVEDARTLTDDGGRGFEVR